MAKRGEGTTNAPWEPGSQGKPRSSPSQADILRARTQPLIDVVLRDAWRDNPQSHVTSNFPQPASELRQVLTSSRRFILDDSMSAFVADLSMARLVEPKPSDPSWMQKRDTDKNMSVMTSLRHSAIPPDVNTWVEMPVRPLLQRLVEMAQESNRQTRTIHGSEIDPDDSIYRLAWLFQSSPDTKTVKMSTFGLSDTERWGIVPFCLPFSFLYRYSDEPLPEHPFGKDHAFRIDHAAAMLAHSIPRIDPCFGVVNHAPLRPDECVTIQFGTKEDAHKIQVHAILPEFVGTLRRAMSLLAALGSIPKVEVPGTPRKGFLARGQIRKPLPCTTYRLSLPAREAPARLAKRILRDIHLAWHEVRPHWRLYEPEGRSCASRDAHLWGAADDQGRARCTQCAAHRTWIVLPRGRGDPSLGRSSPRETLITAKGAPHAE